MADIISLTTIVPILYDAAMATVRVIAEKAAEKATDTALSPFAEKVKRKLDTVLQKEQKERRESFENAVKLAVDKFSRTYGEETQAALATLLSSKSKESQSFVEEITKLYLFSEQPDFDKIRRAYTRAIGFEAILAGHKPLPWAQFSEPLSVFFDDLKAALRDDPLFRPIFDSHTLFNVERLLATFVESVLTPTRGIYVRPAEPTYDQSTLDDYLDYVLREYQYVDPRGIPQVATQVVLKLEEVYVALQADQERPTDVDVDRRMFEQEFEERTRGLKLTEEQLIELKYRIWARRAKSLEAREKVELSDIVRRYSKVVVLGDPGAGKTTLLRFLALQCAKALKEGRSMMPGLGPTRLPVLIRIARYSEARQKNADLALEDYLPTYFEGHGVDGVAPLLADYLRQGKCLVLLDGLDEIVNQRDRAEIASAIQRFVRAFSKEPTPVFREAIVVGKDIGATGAVQETEREKPKAVNVIPPEEQLAEQGNQFVITSRIAGYRIAPLSGEFEHYMIREMSKKQIQYFLDKWCHAVERHLTPDDPKKAEEIAADEISKLTKAIKDNPGVRRMAANPLMLTILALIHRNMTELPQRRVELYDVTTKTLLEKWNPRVRGVDVVIREHEAMALLGPVAFWMHENSPSGLAYRADVETQMQKHLAIRRGLDPENPPLEVWQDVSDFLDKVREFAGIFVERGEGLYGFMHLTFEEYFAARWLVVNPNTAMAAIRRYLHQPRWREPILLGIGYLSGAFFTEYPSSLVQSILEANSEYEDILHRDKLFAAACIADSLYILDSLQQQVISELVAIYGERKGRGRYKSLQQQIQTALASLRGGPGEAVLARELTRVLRSPDAEIRQYGAELVETLEFATEDIVRALLEARLREDDAEYAESALARLRRSNPQTVEALEPKHLLKSAYQQDASLAHLLDDLARDQKFVAFLGAVYGLERREFDYREVEYMLESVLREPEMRLHLEESDVARRDAENELFYRLRELDERLRYEFRMWPFGRGEMDHRLRREIEMLLTQAEHIGGPVYDRLRSLLRFPPEDASPILYLRRDSPVSEVILPVLQRFKHQDLAEARLEEVEGALTKALLTTLATGEGKLHMDAARGLYAYQVEELARQVLDDLNSADVTRCARALSICTSSWYEEGRPEPDILIAAWRRCAAVEQARLLERLVSVAGRHAVTLGLLFELLENPNEQLQAIARSLIEGMGFFEADSNVLALVARELRATSEVRRPYAMTLLGKLKGKEGLEIHASPLTGWLEDEQQDVRIFAAFVLAESAYMIPEVIRLLVEALKDRRDEVRTRAANIVSPSGEITVTASELELWLRLYEANYHLGFVGGEIHDRLVAVKHSDVELVASWFDNLESSDEVKSRLASNALGCVYKATPEIVHLLCEQARHGSATVQRAALDALYKLQTEAPEVVEVLIALLHSSQDESVRSSACNTLGRLLSVRFEVASALLEVLKDPSPKVRNRAAWYLGKMYPRLVKAGTKAPTKEEVRQKLYDALPSKEDDFLNQAFKEPVFQAAADAETALLLLQDLEHIDIKQEIASVLAQSKKLPGIMLGLLDEVRNAPKRQALCDQIFAALVEHLTNEETIVAQNAAEAIARIKQEDRDVLEVLSQHLPDDHEVLRALWASASDADGWGVYHEHAVKNVLSLIEQNPVLVEDLLVALQHQIEDKDGSWQGRRILMAILAAVSERMPATLEAKRPLNEVLQLFVTAARESDSFNTRRWAIKALGNLRQATPEVLEVLFAACRDTSTVYDQAVEAARKFRRIEPGALDLLFTALTDSSVRVCQNAANMLGELGASQEELKKPIAAWLHAALNDPRSTRVDSDGKPLYDYFYDALVKVVGQRGLLEMNAENDV